MKANMALADMKALINKLENDRILTREEFTTLISKREPELDSYLFTKASAIRNNYFGNDIYMRGLIEFTNYCKNDCFYCGIRKSNTHAERYRLSEEQILECCETGYNLGFRTFVLQGGEDGYYSDDRICSIIRAIKETYSECALTLSIGEKDVESYRAYYRAGADRYLLRHETANEVHYHKMHPHVMSLAKRRQCLYELKAIGFQVGCGFMVGSPYQTEACLAEDMLFIRELEPHMVGIGPFIPHHDTPFAAEAAGSLELTLFMLALIRLMLPNVLLPATTALGTIHSLGREMGIQAGANVVMPNLSPRGVRSKYLLYDNKICTGDEAAECCHCLQNRLKGIGCSLVVDRGDFKPAV